MNHDETCLFCQPDESRVVARFENFYLMCGLGQIVEGYLILAAKRHVQSMLDLNDSLAAQLVNVTREARTFVSDLYQPPIFLEHGRVASCAYHNMMQRDRHCYHAHQLIFPVSVDISRDMATAGFPTEQYDSWDEARQLMPSRAEYLYFQDSALRMHFARVRERCPRQFLRYMVAYHLGRPAEGDWRTFPTWDRVTASVQRYSEHARELGWTQ